MAETTQNDSSARAFLKLIEVMARLRNPDTGCPWDVEQDFSTIAPYTIEEAYEVADAIQRGHMNDLKEELGDLLFQVVFHSQMASEEGAFDIADVTQGIADKMVRRHPHVFDAPDQRSAIDQTRAWEVIKAEERAAKTETGAAPSALDGVALSLPALLRAEKLQKRAARVGFDWTEAEPIFDKLIEETAEVREAIANGIQDDIEDEIGDLLFVGANLARRLGIDPEQALRRANAKFERRFRAMEVAAADDGAEFADLDLEAQESYWQRVKRTEKTSG
ncbi:MAG: nucleoside triphosphate pyrophosphohydrolase [Alphaproteobacteria bacterium]|nr:nucleoside triphosphate pyrophosphohydrolase [Alphaproteobacteria bacterium]MBU2083146.1 nucleoside triphosphate pyrophosphohydrolase [Alphaproteobacteria bacterium]MBU2144555.1 nucleoside triphosphate pyrophosphohydrolase [Alphaproteobacteria bacterium]MBU2195430.1 nucleoside triphosphate pyrophosphohydrolase [Alphaproteobacteria bacterium]